MGATKTPPIITSSVLHGTHKLLCYQEVYFCDATTNFIMYNNEYIAKQVQTVYTKEFKECRIHSSVVKSLELKQIMKYIGFPTSSWGEVLW